MPKRILLISIIFASLFFFIPHKKIDKKIGSTITEDPVIVKAEEPTVSPENIMIPKINLNAEIVPEGLDNTNLMAIPDGKNSVGWWKYGSKLGETGRVVLAGHYTLSTGAPGVFFDLKNLTVDDEIVMSGKGLVVKYKINQIETYNTNEFPTNEVYSGNGKKDLVLITCAGQYKNNDYDKRLVILAEKIEE